MNNIGKPLILGCATRDRMAREGLSEEKVSEQKLDRDQEINTNKAAKAIIKAEALRLECVWHLRKRSWSGRKWGGTSKEKLGRSRVVKAGCGY